MRGFLKRSSNSLDTLSLPFAVLVFSIVLGGSAALFFTYGLFPIQTEACRKDDLISRSYCGVMRQEGIYFSILGIVILISSGVALPTESPLIRACSTYRHAATVRLIIGLGVAAVVMSTLTDSLLLDPTDWWRDQKLLSFGILGVFLILFSLALLFTFRRKQRFEQLQTADTPPIGWPINPQRMPVDEVNRAQPQPENVQPSKQRINNELDVQALKEAIKNRRRHFQ
jgi:hypothetical protein